MGHLDTANISLHATKTCISLFEKPHGALEADTLSNEENIGSVEFLRPASAKPFQYSATLPACCFLMVVSNREAWVKLNPKKYSSNWLLFKEKITVVRCCLDLLKIKLVNLKFTAQIHL